VGFTTSSAPPGSLENVPIKHLVAAEMPAGPGKVLFTQIEALCRFPAEPLATRYLDGLMRYLFGGG
jgi:hypothetical protein